MAPERLIPHHLAGDLGIEGMETAAEPIKQPAEAAHERFDARRLELKKGKSMESQYKADMEAKGISIPEGVNVELMLIEGFQETVRDAERFRKIHAEATDPKEKAKAMSMYLKFKSEIQEYTKYGSGFERSYRNYMREKLHFFKFEGLLEERRQLKGLMDESSFASLPEGALDGPRGLSVKDQVRVEQIMRDVPDDHTIDREEYIAGLKTMYDEQSPEYIAALQQFDQEAVAPEGEEPKKLESKKDIADRLAEIQTELEDLWGRDRLRYFWGQEQWDNLLNEFAEGAKVIETPSVIALMNRLEFIRQHHDRSTVGGVVVGPPGTGKTTGIEYYLEKIGFPNAEQIDMSEEVTRYMLFGSKSLEFESPVERMEALVERMGKLSDAEFLSMIKKNGTKFKETFKLSGEGSEEVLAIQMIEDVLDEDLGSGALTPELATKVKSLKERVVQLSEEGYQKELSSDFATTMKKNGWRDGILIHCAREGIPVIINEYNRARNLSFIYGLMTAIPGEKWHFGDNDETITIHPNFRMYMTANIGGQHGVFETPPAFKSRNDYRVVELDTPPTREELQVGLASCAAPDGKWLRSEDDLRKMFILIGEVFKQIRNVTANEPGTVPISYRTIRGLGEELIKYRSRTSKRPIYNPTNESELSFDEALFRGLIETNFQDANPKVQKAVAEICVNAGLLHDPKIREQVEALVGKETYETAIKAHADAAPDYMNKIRETFRQATVGTTAELPVTASV